MKLINKIVWISLLTLPVACHVWEDDLLSERMECGSDKFEANIDDCKFTERHTSEPASVVVTDSTVTFSLHGDVLARNDWQNKWDRRTLSFTFPMDSMKIKHFFDLVALDSLDLDLKSKDSCLVEWKKDYKTDTLNVRSGSLTFTRAKLIGLDGDRNSLFLSGLFDFKYDVEDLFPETDSVKPRDGRRDQSRLSGEGWFDVVITGSNFEKK